MTKQLHPWTSEKLAAKSKKEIEVIRENAVKKGVSDLTSAMLGKGSQKISKDAFDEEVEDGPGILGRNYGQEVVAAVLAEVDDADHLV